MIVANMTSYIGVDDNAEHYYCSYDKLPTS